MEIIKGDVHITCKQCMRKLVWNRRVGPHHGIKLMKRCPDCYVANKFILDERDYDLVMAYRRRKLAILRNDSPTCYTQPDYEEHNKDIIISSLEERFEQEAQDEIKKKYGK